jgi:hypothetical protein
MPLTEWNRCRHNTYKDNRAAEVQYIPKIGAITASSSATVEPAGEQTTRRPHVYSFFRFIDDAIHTVMKGKNKGKEFKATNWSCNLPGCENETRTFKVVGGSTGPLFAHLKWGGHEKEHVAACVASSHAKVCVLCASSCVCVALCFGLHASCFDLLALCFGLFDVWFGLVAECFR